MIRHVIFGCTFCIVGGVFAGLFVLALHADRREAAERQTCKYLAAHARTFPKQFASCKHKEH